MFLRGIRTVLFREFQILKQANSHLGFGILSRMIFEGFSNIRWGRRQKCHPMSFLRVLILMTYENQLYTGSLYTVNLVIQLLYTCTRYTVDYRTG